MSNVRVMFHSGTVFQILHGCAFSSFRYRIKPKRLQLFLWLEGSPERIVGSLYSVLLFYIMIVLESGWGTLVHAYDNREMGKQKGFIFPSLRCGKTMDRNHKSTLAYHKIVM